MAKDPLFCDVSHRLRAAMLEMGVEGNPALRKLINAGDTRVRNWTNGTSMPPAKEAIRLCYALNITMDYIYRGETAGMPNEKAIRLRMAEKGMLVVGLPTQAAVEASDLAGAAPVAGKRGRPRNRAKVSVGARAASKS